MDYPRRFGITDRHSEGIYSNCGFPANMWTISKFDILADIGRPIPRRIESFGTIGKNPGFSYKPVICRKNPGFSPKSRVNPGLALEPEKFLGFRRLGYTYLHQPKTLENFQRVVWPNPVSRIGSIRGLRDGQWSRSIAGMASSRPGRENFCSKTWRPCFSTWARKKTQNPRILSIESWFFNNV